MVSWVWDMHAIWRKMKSKFSLILNTWWLTADKSLTIPSSVAADDESGGEGVDDLKEEAPEEESTEGGRGACAC